MAMADTPESWGGGGGVGYTRVSPRAAFGVETDALYLPGTTLYPGTAIDPVRSIAWLPRIIGGVVVRQTRRLRASLTGSLGSRIVIARTAQEPGDAGSSWVRDFSYAGTVAAAGLELCTAPRLHAPRMCASASYMHYLPGLGRDGRTGDGWPILTVSFAP